MTATVLEKTSHCGIMTIPGQDDITWDTANQASIDQAMTTFTRLTTQEPKMHAAATTEASPAGDVQFTKTDTFDPEADRVIFWRQQQGG